MRPIVTLNDPDAELLRRRSRPVPAIDGAIRRLVADMAVTMRDANGVGLAAVQIGVPLRVLVADTGRGLLALVNPRLRRGSRTNVDDEGCLSVPGVVVPVRRALRVTVQGTLVTGRRVGLRASGFIARILQHEVDHLNGVLFLDRARGARVRRGAARAGATSGIRRPSRARPADRWRGSALAVAASARRRPGRPSR